jgi:FAD/FMN-containing dehydrogenase
MDVQKLQELVEGTVITEPETLHELSTDFGRMIQRIPAAVLGPASAGDVQKALELANENGWQVAVRGAGHSQSGQSLIQDGLLLDMSAMNRIGKVEGASVWVEAGAVWRDVVDAVMREGMIPPVLTNNLNVTVGGTVSMAGLGVASHRFGTQADNVEALEVVTGVGDLVYCSPQENADLFNCVRCGLGQFGVVTRVRLKLRRFSPNVRTYYLLYDRLEALMEDQTRILRQQIFDYVEGWCTPCVQGMRTLGETRVPFAEWFYPVHVSVEYAESAPSDNFLANLKFYRKVYQEDAPLAVFVRRMEAVFDLWRQTGAWNLAHPWMEVILPWDRAPEYIQGVLKSFPPNLLMGGHVLLWPCRGTTSEAPMFIHPGGEFVMGFGILPAVPRQFLGMAVSLLNRASDLVLQVGGKRYLSGWVEYDADRWKAHFGEMWPKLRQWKQFFDPNRILSPGFVVWD